LQGHSRDNLRRHLRAIDLTLLGIGEIIGSGIFIMVSQSVIAVLCSLTFDVRPSVHSSSSTQTGTVAANNAGPAVVLSFLVAGLAALFAALCYAELASVLPISGSAYTYSYATMGEMIAWLIGWDLVCQA
jgi:basic amino acid/polyamine antiporter, APA family